MELIFKTDLDINGNSYSLAIDTDRKEFSRVSRNSYSYKIKVPRKKLRDLVCQCREDGYKEVN